MAEPSETSSSGNTEQAEQQVVHFFFRSGPSNGRRVSKEEIEESREKTRQARKKGIYLSPEQRAQLEKLQKEQFQKEQNHENH